MGALFHKGDVVDRFNALVPKAQMSSLKHRFKGTCKNDPEHTEAGALLSAAITYAEDGAPLTKIATL